MGEFDDEPEVIEEEDSRAAVGGAPVDGVVRVRLPRDKEVLGILDRRLGGSRCDVRCLDGKKRICRIPGRLKRKLWVREGDLVLVEPWEFGGDEKGDIIYKYRNLQIDWLKKKGYLDKLQELDDF